MCQSQLGTADFPVLRKTVLGRAGEPAVSEGFAGSPCKAGAVWKMAQSNLNPSHLPSSPAGSGAVSMFPRHGTPYGPARHAGAGGSHAWRGGRAGPHGSGSREHLRARVRERVHAQGCSCPLCNTSTYRIKPRTAAGAAGSPGGSWAAAVLRDPSPLGEGGHFLPFFSPSTAISRRIFFRPAFLI